MSHDQIITTVNIVEVIVYPLIFIFVLAVTIKLNIKK